MMNDFARRICLTVAAMMWTVVWAGCESDQGMPEAARKKEQSHIVSGTSVVEAIDHDQRMITLRGPSGATITFKAGEEIQRFNEINVGDEVEVETMQALATQIIPASAKDSSAPVAVTEAAGRAPADSAPAMGAARQVRAVFTVEAIDKEHWTADLRDPTGGITTVRVRDRDRLNHTKVGDRVEVTYTEAMVISVKKRSAATR